MGIRIIVAVGAFVLIGFIMLIANAFWGNPISKTIAKNKIEKYVHQVYSLDSKIEKVSYDFYNQFYVSKVRINNQNLDIKSRSNLIYDKNVYDYFQKKFDKDYSAACLALNNNNSIEFPQGVDIFTHVIAEGKYDTDFGKLPIHQKMYLLGFKNSDKTISENDSKQMAGNLAKQLLDILGDRYNFKSIQVIYIDKFGGYEIVIDNKTLTLDELLSHTKKLNNNDIGEEERTFIESLN